LRKTEEISETFRDSEELTPGVLAIISKTLTGNGVLLLTEHFTDGLAGIKGHMASV
jgi:hypothetical protein